MYIFIAVRLVWTCRGAVKSVFIRVRVRVGGKKTERPCTHGARREALFVRRRTRAFGGQFSSPSSPPPRPDDPCTAVGRPITALPYRQWPPPNNHHHRCIRAGYTIRFGRVGGARPGPAPYSGAPRSAAAAPRPPDRPPPPPPPHRRVRVFGPRGGGGGGVFPARRDVVEHSRSVVPVDRTVGVRVHTQPRIRFRARDHSRTAFRQPISSLARVRRPLKTGTAASIFSYISELVFVNFPVSPLTSLLRRLRVRTRIGPLAVRTLSPTAAGSARRAGFSLAP